MKKSEWIKARRKLKKIYLAKGITRCEFCGSTFILSFHHLKKRSSGLAENTFEGTRLLCAKCHHLAETQKEFNRVLGKLRA